MGRERDQREMDEEEEEEEKEEDDTEEAVGVHVNHDTEEAAEATAGEVDDDASLLHGSLQQNMKTDRQEVYIIYIYIYTLRFFLYVCINIFTNLLIYICIYMYIHIHIHNCIRKLTKKSVMFYQLSVLQMEMNRMKEENRVLRKVVEQTMKDYHDLQMKLSTIHQNNQEKVNPGSLFSCLLNICPVILCYA
jgi:FtsZ-binding cell division protein ZapB